MENEKRKNKKVWSYFFGITLIFLGLILNIFGVGQKEFLGYTTVPMYMIFVGIIAIAVGVINSVFNKNRVVDERMLLVASKANRIVFLILILVAFIVMIADGITPVTIPYSIFMSYFICGIVLVYAVSYNIILKLN